jgi:hypothetical protein
MYWTLNPFVQQYLDESGAFINEVNIVHDDSDAALASQVAAGVSCSAQEVHDEC